jgi:hypothetical protein
MTEPTPDNYVPVSRELVLTGIIPWAGRRYEGRIRALVRENPYDRLVFLVPERLLDIYKEHAPANARITSDQATTLGLEGRKAANPNSFLNKVRRALGGSQSA